MFFILLDVVNEFTAFDVLTTFDAVFDVFNA